MAAAEKMQMMRSIIGGEKDTCPGWFWFRGLDEAQVNATLLNLAVQDSAESVRVGALDLLRLARVRISETEWSALPILDESLWVRSSAIHYLSEIGDESAVELLEHTASGDVNPMIAADLKDGRTDLLLRLDPDRVFTEVMSSGNYVSDDMLRRLKRSVGKVSESVLIDLLRSDHEELRRLSAQELTVRGLLSPQMAERLAQDDSLRIRAIALYALAKSGNLPGPRLVRDALAPSESTTQSTLLTLREPEPIPDSDAIIVEYYRAKGLDSTLAAQDWFSVDGMLAYEALALHFFRHVEGSLKDDLSNGFKRIKDQTMMQLEQANGKDAAAKIEAQFAQYESFLRARYTVAALRGIAKNGTTGAAQIARPFLDSAEFGAREAALDVVCRFGDESDVDMLIDLAKSSYGETRRKAAIAAQELSSGSLRATVTLLETSERELTEHALRWLASQKSDPVKKLLSMFLNEEDDSIRLLALAEVVKGASPSELDANLREYISGGTYYYNVVAWLDRLLYAPEHLKREFSLSLQEAGGVSNVGDRPHNVLSGAAGPVV